MKTRKCLASITALALVFTLATFSAPPKAQALTTEITIELIPTDQSSLLVGGESGYPSLSADGSKIVFSSTATYLIAGTPTNGQRNIFLYDVATASITLITTGPAGNGGNGASWYSSISADGTKIVFSSASTDLITGMTTTNFVNTFLYDVASATTTLLTMGPSGNGSNGNSSYTSISADGSKIAFTSKATDLIAGVTTDDRDNIFLYDIATATTTLVTAGSSGNGGNGISHSHSPTPDGAKIVFWSYATNLISGITTNGAPQIFLYDVSSSSTTLITAGPSGTGYNYGSSDPSISADGTRIVFDSFSTEIVEGVTFDFITHTYLYDATNDTMTLMTPGSSGFGGNGESLVPSISADGTKFSFLSPATDLIEGMTTTSGTNIYLCDIASGAITLVTTGSSGFGINGYYSNGSMMSADGTKIVFSSNANDVIAGTSGYFSQIYLATLTTYASVTFDPSNGGITTAEKTVLGTAVDKPADPAREGFAFGGWFTSAGAKWDFGDPVDDDMTLTARWSQLFTVTFDPANGDPIFTEKVPDGEAVNEPTEPLKAEFIFEGWFVSDEVMWDFDDAVVEDIALVAHWVADEEPVVPEEPDEPDEPEEPGVPEGPDGPEGPDEPGIPQTGDVLLLMSIAFMALAGGAMGTVALLRRKRTVL